MAEVAGTDTRLTGPWHDPARSAAERASSLLAAMTLEEKLAQLVGLWVGADASGGGVAPYQSDMTSDRVPFSDVIAHGLGQLTRPFGTAPVEPAAGARSLAAAQREIIAANRFGVPAQVHEECLAGFAAWRATAYPVPLSWGASFDPELVAQMAREIGTSMRSVGVHQGLAPVLDVVQDYRWGRVEETIGEDPYLIGAVGAAYVRGLESSGIVATLKHFAGYSGSQSGRNHGPVSAGPRELADVFLPPFLTALREGGARSVMNSYAAIDGVPPAADPALLTGLLREEWGFAGTVVSDYFSVAFLRTLQHVAATDGEAAALALTAGIDVELPSVAAYGAPLLDAVRSGAVDESLVDRAVLRVLTQKAEQGLLDADWSPEHETDSLDQPTQQETALALAREAVVLLSNDGGVLPLAPGARLALIGPLADDPYAMLGCYSFPSHVGTRHPEVGMGIDVPTVLTAMRAAHDGTVRHVRGCDVAAPGRDGFPDAVAVATEADVAIVVVGDRAGLFGRGTSGEGCDAPDLRLPGEQQALIEAVLETGTPVVVLVISGRPYALGDVVGAAALVQTFFPGQLGARAIAEVLVGAVNPSGHLPVSIPTDPGSQPATYLAPPLGRANEVSNIDPTPLFPFGHGRSYEELNWGAVSASSDDWATDGEISVQLELTNQGTRATSDVVQVYLHDPVASVARPEALLVAFHRLTLDPSEQVLLTVHLHADLASFTGRDGRRVVEPGEVELRVARSSADVHRSLRLRLVGEHRQVDASRHLLARADVAPAHPVIEEEVSA